MTISPLSVVMYEQDGTPVLGLVLGNVNGKYVVLTDQSREVELPDQRLFVFKKKLSATPKSHKERLDVVQGLLNKAIAKQGTAKPVAEVWASLTEQNTPELSTEDFSKLFFGTEGLPDLIAARLLLLEDKEYFKREKNGFSPRSKEVVEKHRAQHLEVKKRVEARVLAVSWIKERSKNKTLTLPAEIQPWITALEDLYVERTPEFHPKEMKEFLEGIKTELSFSSSKDSQDLARTTLKTIGWITPTTNPNVWRHRPPQSFDKESLEEGKKIAVDAAEQISSTDDGRKDLTGLNVITIDDASTKDIDDAISITQILGGYEIGVHIADVAAWISPDAHLTKEIFKRTTSTYLPEFTIPMLPRELSEEALSLHPGQKRKTISVIFTVNEKYEIQKTELLRSIITSKKRLSYDEVDAQLEDEKGDPDLLHLYNATLAHESKRRKAGAIKFSKPDVNVKVDAEGNITIAKYDEQTPARQLIAELMVMANIAFAKYAQDNGIPSVFRCQEPIAQEIDLKRTKPAEEETTLPGRPQVNPSYLSSKPARHASLAAAAYTQVTSPIRRASDFVTQTQIANHLASGKIVWSAPEVNALIQNIEEGGVRAQSLTKESKRYWLLRYLLKRGLPFETSGTMVRVDLRFPVLELDEVYVSFGARSRKTHTLGERVTVKITDIYPDDGVIRGEILG
jgi:exoribonuclease-2